QIDIFYFLEEAEMLPKKRSYAAVRKYSSDSLKKALDCLKTGGISVKRAANLYNIDRSTLINHLKNHKCILSQEEEQP
ncbi:hypothetical protein JTB14_000838, partial [Gonioctena quinquepunctata]